MTSERRDEPSAEILPEPSWDVSGGKRGRRPLPPLLLPLTSRFRIISAAEHAAGAALAIAVAHFWTALFVADGRGPKQTLIGSDPRLLACVQITAGLLALYLAVRSRRRPSVPIAWFLMGWALFEAVPWIPRAIYGHAVFGKLGGFYAVTVVYFAAQGVRGANALKRLESYPKPPDGPLQLGA
jgi:hypothetical protein